MKAGLSSIGLSLTFLCGMNAQGQLLVTPGRAHPWRLSDSLRREAHAALDRGLAWLAIRQAEGGLWEQERGLRTGLPALAFAGDADGIAGDPVSGKAFAAVSAEVGRSLTRILTPGQTMELALGTLLLRSCGGEPSLLDRAVRRLRLQPLERLSAEESAWTLEAQGWREGEPGKLAWGAVIAKAMAFTHATPGQVALAGVARWERGGTSPNAFRAHLRWLADRWPERASDTWWLVQFLERMSPAQLHEAGFPLDWRRRVAGDLIASQRFDPATGHGYWSSGGTLREPDDDEMLRETTFALLVLKRLAD